MMDILQVSPAQEQSILGLQAWLKTRAHQHTAKFKQLFQDDGYLMIGQADYKAWKANNPEYIHAYPVIKNGKLHFALIDELSDKALAQDVLNRADEMICIKPYAKTLKNKLPDLMREAKDGNITVEDGLKRIFRWQQLRDSWLERQLELTTTDDNGLFYMLKIPFEVLAAHFEAGYTTTFAFMGLKEFKNLCGCPVDPAFYQDLQADMVLIGYKDKFAEISSDSGVFDKEVAPTSWISDTTVLCPPFCGPWDDDFPHDPEPDTQVNNGLLKLARQL